MVTFNADEARLVYVCGCRTAIDPWYVPTHFAAETRQLATSWIEFGLLSQLENTEGIAESAILPGWLVFETSTTPFVVAGVHPNETEPAGALEPTVAGKVIVIEPGVQVTLGVEVLLGANARAPYDAAMIVPRMSPTTMCGA